MPHGRAPDGDARRGQRRKNPRAVDGGEDEDRDEHDELGEEQAAVRRPGQGGDTLDLSDRVQRARGHQEEHHDQRGTGEAPRREHGIGARVGAVLTTRRS